MRMDEMLGLQDQIDIFVMVYGLFRGFPEAIIIDPANYTLHMIVRFGGIAVMVVDMQSDIQQGLSYDSSIGNFSKDIKKGYVASAIPDRGKLQIEIFRVNMGSSSIFIFQIDSKSIYQSGYRIFG